MKRIFYIYLPNGLKPDAPVVFYLHGYDGGITKQNTFKTVAPIAGLTMEWIYRDLEASTIPLFEIHGIEDRISEWTGDLTNEGGVSLINT